jgi:GxxExxY protein
MDWGIMQIRSMCRHRRKGSRGGARKDAKFWKKSAKNWGKPRGNGAASLLLSSMTENELSKLIVDLFYRIHKQYGPGLFESVYEEIFCHEWEKTGIPYKRQQAVALVHETIKLEAGFRADVIIDNKVIVEFKSIEVLNPVHYKQVQTYLRLTGLKLGLLVNFNVVLIKDGIRRIVNNL